MSQLVSDDAPRFRRGSERDIALGEPVPFCVRDAVGNLLLAQGSIVATEHPLRRLLERGFMVPDTPSASVAETPRERAEAPACVFTDVRALADELQHLHHQLLAGTHSGLVERLWKLVNDVERLASLDADAALASMLLHGNDEGLGARLLHAALLCGLLADALELDAATRRSTLAAALTFEVAMTPIAMMLNHQHTPLTPTQRALVDAHPAEACALLERVGVTDLIWLDGVLHHHERVDGSGYPARLQGDSIPLCGRILGIVDSFSAMVRPGAYRDAVLCRVALRELFLQRSRSVDERLATLFVREVGMYPPGSLVKLANGEICIVARRGPQVVHPDVRLLLDAQGQPAEDFPMRDTREPGFEIVESAPLQKYRALLAGTATLWVSPRAAGGVGRSA